MEEPREWNVSKCPFRERRVTTFRLRGTSQKNFVFLPRVNLRVTYTTLQYVQNSRQ